MLSDDILQEIEQKTALKTAEIVEGAALLIEKEVTKGHRQVNNCPYCTSLYNYSRLKIKEHRAIKAMKREYFFSWPYHALEHVGFNKLQSEIYEAQQLKNYHKNMESL